jgi:hypothetical protein
MSTQTNTEIVKERVALLQTTEDLKTALLFVSLAVNAFLFITWLVVQVDPTVALVLVQTS